MREGRKPGVSKPLCITNRGYLFGREGSTYIYLQLMINATDILADLNLIQNTFSQTTV